MTINYSSAIKSIVTELENNAEEVISWRRYLHKNPELSFEEVETAKYIADTLESFGIKTERNIGGNGVIGSIQGSKSGPVIGLRADFDALPIEDEKNTSYVSTNPGVMHACGHDGHTAALLGTAKVLNKFKEELPGKVVFIFQHAEEKPPGGAKSMIEALDMDDFDYIFAAHLASDIPIGDIAVGAGAKMAAVDKFKLTINGYGGHGAKPHETNDPIVIGSDIVSILQKVVSRRIDPLESAVLTLGVFHAGNAFNVIPDKAVLEGTVRTLNEEVRKQVKNNIYSLVKGVTEGYGATFELDYLHGYPTLNNQEAETEIVRTLFSEMFGENHVVPFNTGMGAEDFSYFLREKPGNYFRVGSRNDDERTHYPHHHPKFDIDEQALLNIQKAFVQIIFHQWK